MGLGQGKAIFHFDFPFSFRISTHKGRQVILPLMGLSAAIGLLAAFEETHSAVNEKWKMANDIWKMIRL